MAIPRARIRPLALALALATGIGALIVSPGVPASADPGGIVLSELNYHAGSDLDGDDFLELANTSAVDIDVSGWSFSAGVTGTFPAGLIVPANGFIVVGKDAAQFELSHGFAPDAIYGGNLSNSGETVTLVDGSLAVIDTVSYADTAPWPTAPDGTGPSLELRDLLSDNSLAENWGASIPVGGTPKAVNSIAGTGVGPVVTEATATPARPAANQAVSVSARLQVGSTATLTYTVMFGADVVIPFVDNAASPGGAGDGVYAGSIPGQSAGKLIRYRIDAVAGSVAYSEPASGDSMRYRGVVVVNSSVVTQLPVIEWFMDDAVYNDLLAHHREDDVQGAAVWSYNGDVYDNVRMNIRGHASRAEAKVNWKVELPAGYTFTLGGALPYPLDEFALQNYAYNFTDVSWATVKAAGNRALNIIPVRTQRNGAFWSLGRIQETEDKRWRSDQGVSNWAIYKGDGGAVARRSSVADLVSKEWLNKKTRKDEDYSDVFTLGNTVDAPASAAQQAWIYQNVNIPELVNYMAINSVIRHTDSGWYNWWLARDTDGTGRWDMWQWDLNWTFTVPSSDGKGLFLTPDTQNRFTTAMLGYPEIREMYYRRLSSLSDQFLTPGKFEAQWDAISAKTTPDWKLDKAKWGGYSADTARTAFLAGLADRRAAIIGNTGAGKLVPVSQSANAAVVINEIQYHPSGTGGEYIELANPSATAVDISGWSIAAVGLSIQAGTVIPAGGRVVFVANDKAFRAAYTGANRFVGGQFSGTLDDGGEAVVLADGARIVDAVTYSNMAPWPVAADGTGPSLELVSPTADNADPASWRAASTSQGTPGLANTPDGPANAAPIAAMTATVTGLAVVVDGSTSRDPDGSIRSYAWNFGDNSTGSGVSASHSYAAAGTYTISLTVTDNRGATGTASRAVTVTAPSGVWAADSFTRTITGGFGTADAGGVWTTSDPASAFAVDGTAAKVTVPSGANRRIYLNGVKSSDTEMRTAIAFPRQTTSSLYAGVISRQVGTSNYGARVVVSATGSVLLQAQRNTDIILGAATVGGVTFATGDTLNLKVQTFGTSPTMVRAKAWKTGSAEPTGWQVSVTDTTAALQTGGSVGLYSYLSSSARPTPIVVTFDDLWAGVTR